MHKNEPRANPTLINRIIMVYELRARTIETHKSIDFFIIQSWNWFNISLKKINYTIVPYVKNNEMKLKSVTYYLLHADSSLLVFII